jgi:xanthine dehydrogenase accessory factor
MREVLDELLAWWSAGEVVGAGTVVETFRSAPQPPGATMLVGPDGTVVGSVSGGCVEGTVYDLATEVRETKAGSVHRFGVSDDEAFSVGLTCGGELAILVTAVDRTSFPDLDRFVADVRAGRPVALATVIDHPDPSRIGRRLVLRPDRLPSTGGTATGELGSERLEQAVLDDGLGLLAAGQDGVIEYGPDGQRLEHGCRVLVSSFAPPPRLIVFGAIDFARSMTTAGRFLGYDVTLCDARPVFTTPERFPDADRVVVDWPHRYLAGERDAGRLDARTAITVLTHDPKFDVPLLEVALRLTEVGYVGAMGSRNAHDDRLARLREAGLTPDQLARLRSPIGLDLRGRTAAETALSIGAEIVALRWGGTGVPLTDRFGSIHQHATDDGGITMPVHA